MLTRRSAYTLLIYLISLFLSPIKALIRRKMLFRAEQRRRAFASNVQPAVSKVNDSKGVQSYMH